MSETPVENNEVKEEEVNIEGGPEVVAEEIELEAEVLDFKEEVSAEAKELEEFKSKFYYIAAEMENLKKRHARDMQTQLKYGNEKVLKGLLDVVDNLDRTITAIENDEDEKVKNIYVGIDMVKKQFIDTLKSNGLEQIDALGKEFDPNVHEAMTQQPAEGKEDGEVLQVFQEGYRLNGRLLRASKVIIVKN